MKITVYTTTDCQFSKAERDYLNTNKLAFEEKNLDTNKEFLQEMMTVGNNFAGTPVTRIEKDDGSIAVLKGFIKTHEGALAELNVYKKDVFHTTLGLNAAQATPTPPPTATVNEPSKVQGPAPVETTPEPAVPPVVETPTAPPSVVDPKLNSVLDKLEEKTATPTTPAAPAIPDFPTEAKTTNISGS